MYRTSTFLTLFALLVGFACVLVGQPTTVHGQLVPSLSRMDISGKPEIPGPNTSVLLTLKSYSLSLDTARVTWRVNGEVVKSARGALQLQLTTGGLGSVTTVEATADAAAGTLSASLVLRPQYVGIAWEAQTYTPVLYRGKALHTPGSKIRATALPVLVGGSGVALPADDLQYTWTLNKHPQPQLSGYGRQSVLLENSKVLQPLNVAVEVRSRDNTLVARNEITIPIVQPEVLLYEKNPLLGVRYAHALGTSYALPPGEATVVAEPFYLSSPTRDDSTLTFDWRIGNNPIDARGIVTLRPEGTGEGSVPLSLVLRNTTEPLQSARTTVQVLFKAAESDAPNFLTL